MWSRSRGGKRVKVKLKISHVLCYLNSDNMGASLAQWVNRQLHATWLRRTGQVWDRPMALCCISSPLSTNLIWAFPSQLFSICAFLFFWLHRRRASWDCDASITRTLNMLIILCLCLCNGPKYKIELFNTWSCFQDVGSRSKVFTHKTIQTTRGKGKQLRDRWRVCVAAKA